MKVPIKYVVIGQIAGLWKCNCPNCRDGGTHLLTPKTLRFIDLHAVNAEDAKRHTEEAALRIDFPECESVVWVQGPEITEVERE